MGRLGGNIEVQGNSQSTRSYMYPTDMISWLLSILVNPSLSPINVGSEDSKTMLEIASLVANVFDSRVAVVGGADFPESHYVPDTRNTKSSYGVSEDISLIETLRRWNKWLDFQPRPRGF
jgi:nucleoside-diphosphate-sugar epimerase